ncbi:phospholipase a2 activating, putative [Ichthyophthirius multifiliis]|uniref:Phospholipase a2 activating, putative n=1 Tax=Ichthyophthirius multifiliis TaxID=5932 RepID=G0R114_ICHMU|nr:phospholipase a2 activating, putative [Ichthyophthirius multifiliis]EGR28845.1 phospholipase a2 activating, putative [Ichthyophthirius multifiliis]|eukprot:XP_004030081.1 phospholipase a2 activating, putative [Ichthyophthirius multifiliis]
MDIEQLHQYQLSQQFACHTQGVRCVHIEKNFLISGSTDKTVKIFQFVQELKKYELLYEANFFDDYIYSVKVLQNGNGFIIGSKDKNIYILDLSGNPIQVLNGHEGPVNSLCQYNDNTLISGSWDASSRIWNFQEGKEIKKLEGHSYAVCVLGINSQDLIITGSQDGIMHFWQFSSFKEIRKIKAHKDIIREIQYIEESGLLLSCSNDMTLKVWSLEGDQVNVLEGHSGFVFSCVCFSFGNYVSGGEDALMNIWKGETCIQGLKHPGTVWNICINRYNMDIISACSDGNVRVFVKDDAERTAGREEIEDFEKKAAVQKGVSNDEISKLPKVEEKESFQGKKKGEIKLFRNGDVAEAFQWDLEKGIWEKIGEVLNQQNGSFQKKLYEGDSVFPKGNYDYIFQVEDDSGFQKKLPFNNNDNPLEIAEKYCVREQISKGNVEQIRKFLIANSNCTQNQQQQQGQQSQQHQNYQNQQVQKKDKTYTYFTVSNLNYYEQMNIEGMKKKFNEINLILKDTDHYLNDKQLFSLNFMLDMLQKTNMYHNSKLSQPQLEVFTLKLLKWPQEHILPVLDLFRIFALHPQSDSLFTGVDSGLNYFTILIGGLGSLNEIGKGLIMKTLCNLFSQTNGKYGMFQHCRFLIEGIKYLRNSQNQNLRNCLVCFFYNVSAEIVFNQNYKNENILAFLEELIQVFQTENNPDNILRILISFGNFVIKYENVSKQVLQKVDFAGKLIQFQDQKIQQCLTELNDALEYIMPLILISYMYNYCEKF